MFSPINSQVACQCSDENNWLSNISANPTTVWTVCTNAGKVGPLAFMGDGLGFWFWESDSSIQVWDFRNEIVCSLCCTSAEYTSIMLSFSLNKDYIVMLYMDEYLDIWDISEDNITANWGMNVNGLISSPPLLTSQWLQLGCLLALSSLIIMLNMNVFPAIRSGGVMPLSNLILPKDCQGGHNWRWALLVV